MEWQRFDLVPLCGAWLEFINLTSQKKKGKCVHSVFSWKGPDDEAIKPQLAGFRPLLHGA